MKPLKIETERLQLIPFCRADVTVFHQLNIDPFIRKYLWDDEEISIDTANDIMLQNEQYFEQNQYGLWKVYLKSTNDLIGYTGLWFFFNESQPQLLYALLAKSAKRGYATEFAKAIIDYSFTKLGFSYVLAAMDEPHLASQNVAKRLGMKFWEGRLVDGKVTLFYKIER